MFVLDQFFHTLQHVYNDHDLSMNVNLSQDNHSPQEDNLPNNQQVETVEIEHQKLIIKDQKDRKAKDKQNRSVQEKISPISISRVSTYYLVFKAFILIFSFGFEGAVEGLSIGMLPKAAQV